MIAEIAQGLADRAAATTGIASTYAEPPPQLGDRPCAVVFDDPERRSSVTLGASEMWMARYLVRIYVATLRNIANEITQARPFVEAYLEAIRAKYQLGIAGVYGVQDIEYILGTAQYGGTEYVVADIYLTVKAKQATEITV